MELILVRHAETRLNEARRFQGWLDPDLSPRGVARAGRLAATVAGMGPDLVFSSDLRRCWRTADLLVPGAVVRRDPRLRELRFGAFEGATWEENLSLHGDRFRSWVRDPEGAPPPGGEALGHLRRRVLGWLADLPERGRVLVVTHGGPLRVILARCLARPPMWSAERGLLLPPGAVARVAWEPA